MVQGVVESLFVFTWGCLGFVLDEEEFVVRVEVAQGWGRVADIHRCLCLSGFGGFDSVFGFFDGAEDTGVLRRN
jgi:hypothetical protein